MKRTTNSSEASVNAAGTAEFFSPQLFAHGRVLYRYPGSDACRFSQKLAYSLIEHIPTSAAERPSVLWDPFCGTGMIVSIACLFFPGKFQTIVGSDIAPEAVECAAKNLSLVSSVESARKRLKFVRGLRGMHAKACRRWGEVAEYLESLMPLIEQTERFAPTLRTFTASAFALPPGIEGDIHFVGDVPYGRTSHMGGGRGVTGLLDCIAEAYPNATMRFVMPRDAGEAVLRETRSVAAKAIPCRNARLIVGGRPKEPNA